MTKPTKNHQRLPTIGLGLLILLALLAIFHRPIVFEATRYFVVRAAKQQNLDVKYAISGSILSTLTISNLRVTPTESGPIQRLEVEKIHLQYSLWGAIRNGLPALLKVVDARNIFVELTPGNAPPAAKQTEPQAFKFPALFPELLNVENVNIVVHTADEDFMVSNLSLSLLPDRPGELTVENVRVPGLQEWNRLSAKTTFQDRNLNLTGFAIEPGIFVRRFNIDASRLDKSALGIHLDGRLFAAEAMVDVQIRDLNATNQTQIQANLSGLVLDAVWQFLNIPPSAAVELTQLTATFGGKLASPESWTGQVDLALIGLNVQQFALGDTQLSIHLADGRATLDLAQSMTDGNRASANATIDLPETINNFSTTRADAQFEVILPNVESLTATMPEVIRGSLTTSGTVNLANGVMRTDITIDSESILAATVEASGAHVQIHAEKKLENPEANPVFAGLITQITAQIAAIRIRDFEVEKIRLDANSRDDEVVLETLSLNKGANAAQVAGTTLLPQDMKSFATQPMRAELKLDAPSLSDFLAEDAKTFIQGNLQVKAELQSENGVRSGQLIVTGRGLEFEGFQIRTIDGNMEVEDDAARVRQFIVVMDDENSISADGSAVLKEPYSYDGKIEMRLQDVSRFQPLLAAAGSEAALAGALNLAWHGSGNAKELQQNGRLTLTLTGGRFGDVDPITAHVSGDYTPEYINVRDVRLSAGSFGEAAFSAFWKDNRLQISNLSARQRNLVLLEGNLEVPLVLSESGDFDRMVPSDRPLKISLRTSEIDLRSLFNQLEQKPTPATGRIQVDIEASGPLNDLEANVNLRGKNLRSAATGDLDPAEVSLTMTLRDAMLSLNGTVKQELIRPVVIAGRIPLDVAEVKRSGTINPQTPLDFRFSLPQSSLASINRLVPAIRQSRGNATADVRMTGTIAKPLIGGSVTANLDAMRFTDPALPPLDGVTARLSFSGDRMQIEQLRGRLAGGDFDVGGGLNFANAANPELDFRMVSRNALILQNDDLTVRVSTDIKIRGPLNSGTISGNVFVTKSRFFKDIDILPIGLPGRPAPQPPPEPDVVSFPAPPLRDWKFDVRIQTRDPFLIQSNLANGRVTMDLRLGGSGLEPWLDGSIQVEQLTASLPFSRLEIDSGLIYFSRDSPFVPQLNLRGTSTIRDYDLSVFIYGPVTAPEAVFSSNPPLPQSEIVSLIATGTTTAELANDPNALAGRGAILLFQQLYRRVFRRNQPPPENESFLSRIQFDIGTTDPKTGQQSASARVPLTDQIVLVGGLDVGGNFRGQVKYLLRFK